MDEAPLENEALQVFSSLRLDRSLPPDERFQSSFPFVSRAYLLEYHRDRMIAAALDLGWTDVVNLLGGDHGMTVLMENIGRSLPPSVDELSFPYKVHASILQSSFRLLKWSSIGTVSPVD